MTVKTDRELLELAARAVGITLTPVEVKNVEFQGDDRWIGYMTDPSQWARGWFDPLTDDGDALRLAVKLGMELDFSNNSTTVEVAGSYRHMFHAGEAMARTRLIIVRAAAAIGGTL